MPNAPRTLRYIATFAVLSAGCATHPAPGPAGSPTSSGLPAWSASVLDATLWVQTSAEYAALSRQTWAAAGRMMEAALADTSWTAALEQQAGYGALPPAVIVDVDETVLDNAPYAARLIQARPPLAGAG